MAAKTKLKHLTSTGELATRLTARDYTHVVCVQGHLHDHIDQRKALAYLKADSEERYEKAVARAEAAAKWSRENEVVLSWHGSAMHAAKAADAARARGYKHVKVEPINGGERDAATSLSNDSLLREAIAAVETPNDPNTRPLIEEVERRRREGRL